MTIPYSDLKRLIKRSAAPTPGMIQIIFKGYAVEDLNCKYCLHYSGRTQSCLVDECCCNEEKQAVLDAAKN